MVFQIFDGFGLKFLAFGCEFVNVDVSVVVSLR